MNQGEAVELIPIGDILEKNMKIDREDPGKSSGVEHTVSSTGNGKFFLKFEIAVPTNLTAVIGFKVFSKRMLRDTESEGGV